MIHVLKHCKVVFIVIIFIIIPFSDFTRPFQGIVLQKAMGNEKFHQVRNYANYDLLDKLVIVPERAKSTKALIGMLGRINSIDRSVLDMLTHQGVKIRLFEGRLTDEPLLYYLKWQEPRGWNHDITWSEVPGAGGSWLVSAKVGASEKGSGHGSINLELHEIGHTVYRILNSSNDYANRLKDIWLTEVESMFPDKAYFQDYPSEYFSEMFAYYYYSEESVERIKAKAPETYCFLASLKREDLRQIPLYYY
ncbi:anthrax toxin lethal factor-related metalloendopeptidase [Sediminibacillus massiliensis]|uniref:anthrax toxin lethal factor-related metalloendopeptidase n=1 Tax=Sediminibacillus massiliensis TaxID=1926277 RepID=UPI0009883361|nr:hypothetical protein [Sediminibacillus massiliensis]